MSEISEFMENTRMYEDLHIYADVQFLYSPECVKHYNETLIGYLRNCFGGIKRRCNNPKHKFYKYYGGRGIKCLFESPDEFINYIVNELKVDPRGFDIDRINNDGNYEPGNIRFVTHKENCNNRKKNLNEANQTQSIQTTNRLDQVCS